MKIIWPLTVLLFTLTSMSIGGKSTPSLKNTDDQRLKLELKVVDHRYCVGDSDLDALKLTVGLTLTNISQQRLILYKRADVISQITVAAALTDMEAGRFEVDSSVTQLVAGGAGCFSGRVPSKCFIVLPPGASHQAQSTIRVFVVRDQTREITGAVTSGEHVLKVKVSTWPESESLSKKLRSRWETFGYLWDQPINSVPLHFKIAKDRKVEDCL